MKHLIIILLLSLFGSSAFAQTKTAKEYYEASKEAVDADDLSLALSQIQKAIVLDGSEPDYFLMKALIQERNGDPSEAFKTYCETIRFFPKQPDAYIERARILVSVREFELASDDYEVALGLSTTDTMKYHILTNRSVLKSAVRNFQGAYDDLIQAYRWDTTNVAVLVNLGSACDELGKSDESVMYLMKAIEQDSTCYLAYINLGFHYQTKGEHQLAIDFFDKSLSIEENDPVSLNNRSYSKLQLGDVDGAMEDVSASLKGYPENSYAYRNRALIYLRMNKKNKACADLETAVEKGFTEEYGNEVEKLLKEHCGK